MVMRAPSSSATRRFNAVAIDERTVGGTKISDDDMIVRRSNRQCRRDTVLPSSMSLAWRAAPDSERQQVQSEHGGADAFSSSTSSRCADASACSGRMAVPGRMLTVRSENLGHLCRPLPHRPGRPAAILWTVAAVQSSICVDRLAAAAHVTRRSVGRCGRDRNGRLDQLHGLCAVAMRQCLQRLGDLRHRRIVAGIVGLAHHHRAIQQAGLRHFQ